MSTLHMETDDVSAVADYLQRASHEISQTSYRLRHSVNRLSANWSGYQSGHYIRQMNARLQAMEELADNVALLGRRVHLEVEQWLEADRSSANRLAGSITPIPVPTPTPLKPSRDYQGEQQPIHGTDLGVGLVRQLGKVWDWAELGLLTFASGFIVIGPGATYVDQVIIKGPQWAKELWGLSPHLTHAKDSSFATHIGKGTVNVPAIALISPILRTVDHWLETANTPHQDDLRAGTAMFIDTVVIFGTSLALAAGGSWIGAQIGGWIGGSIVGIGGASSGSVVPGAGTVVGGTVGAAGGGAAGAMIGGVVGAMVGDYLAGIAIDNYLQSDLRDKLIDAVVNVIRAGNPAQASSRPQAGGGW